MEVMKQQNGDLKHQQQAATSNGSVLVHNNSLVHNNDDGATANGDLPDKFCVPSIENRVKRRAKRPSQLVHSNSDSAADYNNGHSNNSSRCIAKNSRKSRNGFRFGRGLPKKGGAGGKGTWGKYGVELLNEDESTIDECDPNYDSDVQTTNCEFVAISPPLSGDDMKKVIEPIIQEYFENADTYDAALSLEEVNAGQQYYKIPTLAITLAMDRKPSHCELTSVLISDLCGSILTTEDIVIGFTVLLNDLPDLVLDTPDAPNVLGNFIARAIADDCLAPKFIRHWRVKKDGCDYARMALNHADTLLNMKHGMVRLDNVWGVGGGIRPVKYLIKKMVMLLKEYLSSGDMEEAVRCIHDLEVPHFHHELVYEAIVMVLEDMKTDTQDPMCSFLNFLYKSVIITPEQLNRGFDRVYKAMPDISIDVPLSYNMLEKFVGRCMASGFLSDSMVKKMPVRGRKRFVSEGDGGLVKEVYF